MCTTPVGHSLPPEVEMTVHQLLQGWMGPGPLVCRHPMALALLRKGSYAVICSNEGAHESSFSLSIKSPDGSSGINVTSTSSTISDIARP
jgi:hypothetical protein